MANTVEQAAYLLSYDTGDSTQKVSALDNAVNQLVGTTEKSVVSEEKVTTARRTSEAGLINLTARYDSTARFIKQYEAALQQLARYEADGIGSAQQLAAAQAAVNNRFGAMAANSVAQFARSLNVATESHRALSTQSMAAFHATRSMIEGFAIGIPPTQIFAQQIAHLSYAMTGPGGLKAAFGDVLKSLTAFITPVTVTIGLLAGALAGGFALATRAINQSAGDLTKGLGLTDEQLKRVKEHSVTFKDTVVATFQVLWRDISSNFQGAFDAIGKALDWLTDKAGKAVAAIAGFFGGAYEGIVATWKQIPSVLGDVFVSAANAGIRALQFLIDKSTSGLNALIDFSNEVNKLPIIGSGVQLGHIEAPELGQIKNEFAGAGAAAAGSFSDAFKKGFSGAQSAVNQFYSDVASQAKQNRIDQILKEAGDSAKKSAKDAKDALDEFDKVLNKYAAQYEHQSEQLQKAREKLDEYNKSLQQGVEFASQTSDERERLLAIEKEIKLAKEAQVAPDIELVNLAIRQRQEAQQLGRTADSIQSSFQDFFTNIFSHGKNAFGQLVDSIKQQFAQLLAWLITRAIAQPIIVPIIESVTGGALNIASALGAGGTAGGAGGIGILGSLGNLSSAGSLTGNTGFLGQIGSTISSATSWLTNGINSIGTSLGFGTSVPNLAGYGPGIIQGSSSIFGATALSGLLGGGLGGLGIGSVVGSLLGGNSTGSTIGGGLGGLAGTLLTPILGPLGPILGSALGGALGGLFGGKPSAHRATANFDENYGLTGVTGTKLTQQGQQMATSAGQTISQVVQALQSAGLDLTNNISKLTIATARDKSFITTTSGQRIDVGPVGDAQAAVKGTLDYLLKGLSSTDTEVQKVIAHYKALGGITADNADQFAQDVQFAKSLESISFDTTKQLSQTQQAMQAISQQFDDTIAKAKELGLDTANIVKAEQQAFNAIAAQANDNAKLAYESIVAPALASYAQLKDAQTQALSDAKAVGADMSLVNKLNSAQMQQFLMGLSDADRAMLVSSGVLSSTEAALAKSITKVTDGIDSLIDRATAAGQAAQQASQAWSNAKNAVTQARNALLVAGPGVSPQNAYFAGQQQYMDLRSKAQTDPAAAQAFAQFASQYLQLSYAYNASGPKYGSDFAKVQTDLAALATKATKQESAQDKLVAQAAASVDALNAMKAQLASGMPNITLLQQQLSAQNKIVTAIEAGNSAYATIAAATASTIAAQIAANDNALVKAVAAYVASAAPVAPIASASGPTPPKSAAPAVPKTNQADGAVNNLALRIASLEKSVASLDGNIKNYNLQLRTKAVA